VRLANGSVVVVDRANDAPRGVDPTPGDAVRLAFDPAVVPVLTG
jgi:hypothetical protein